MSLTLNLIVASGFILAGSSALYFFARSRYEKIKPSDYDIRDAFIVLRKSIKECISEGDLKFFEKQVEEFWVEYCSRGNLYAIRSHTQLLITAHHQWRKLRSKIMS